MYGHIYRMAEAVVEGARKVEGAEVGLYQVAELVPVEALEKIGAKAARSAFGHEFGDLIQADFGAFNFARSFHYGLGHAVDVAVHAVKEYLNPHAHCRFLTYSNKLPEPRTGATPHNSPAGASATSALNV